MMKKIYNFWQEYVMPSDIGKSQPVRDVDSILWFLLKRPYVVVVLIVIVSLMIIIREMRR